MIRSLLIAVILTAAARADLTVTDTGKALTIKGSGGNDILSYQYADYAPPEGVDKVYTRSGFIYPLATPKGTVITGIHPDDHYHHFGLWHPWTKTKMDGQEVDFWNLKSKQGTMRFAKLLKKFDGKSAGFIAKQQHVQLNHKDGERVVIDEELSITVTETNDKNIVDYAWKQVPVIDTPVKLPAYRYGGGLAFRATPNWNAENSAYLTSEGKNWQDGHATRARWCLISGPGDKEGQASILLMNHPSNHDYPQRMRIHPEPIIFFNYVPQQENAWQLNPGETHTMRYRVITFDKIPQAAEIESLWSEFIK